MLHKNQRWKLIMILINLFGQSNLSIKMVGGFIRTHINENVTQTPLFLKSIWLIFRDGESYAPKILVVVILKFNFFYSLSCKYWLCSSVSRLCVGISTCMSSRISRLNNYVPTHNLQHLKSVDPARLHWIPLLYSHFQVVRHRNCIVLFIEISQTTETLLS